MPPDYWSGVMCSPWQAWCRCQASWLVCDASRDDRFGYCQLVELARVGTTRPARVPTHYYQLNSPVCLVQATSPPLSCPTATFNLVVSTANLRPIRPQVTGCSYRLFQASVSVIVHPTPSSPQGAVWRPIRPERLQASKTGRPACQVLTPSHAPCTVLLLLTLSLCLSLCQTTAGLFESGRASPPCDPPTASLHGRPMAGLSDGVRHADGQELHDVRHLCHSCRTTEGKATTKPSMRT